MRRTHQSKRGSRSAKTSARTSSISGASPLDSEALAPPEGNTNNLQHGAYANRFLSDEERQLFDALIAKLRADFKFNESSDFIQVELVAIYFLKLGRAQEAGDWEVAQKIDQMLRCHLKDLKATKIAREGEEPRAPETTPAEWASALLQRWTESQKPKRRSRSKKRGNDFG